MNELGNDTTELVPGAIRPGECRNPLGINGAKKLTLQQRAQRHTRKAIQVLLDIMQNEDAKDSARVAAANSILDRGHGKAPQTIRSENSEENQARILDVIAQAAAKAHAALNGTAPLTIDQSGEVAAPQKEAPRQSNASALAMGIMIGDALARDSD